MLDEVLQFLKDNGAESRDAAQNLIEKNYSLEMGENLQIKDYEILSGDVSANYVHSNAKLAAVVLAAT